MRTENVVEFPTGRPLPHLARRPTVAALARRLSSGLRIGASSRFDSPVPLDLCELTGVSDPTIARLKALVGNRVLSGSSAARLALRHAREVGGSCGSDDIRERERDHEFILIGDPFGRFAFRIGDRRRGAWVAYASLADLHLLLGVCPNGAGPICIFPGADADDRPTVVLRQSRDWRRDLERLSRLSSRTAERHVLIVGGLPGAGPMRARAIAGIEEGLRRGGMHVRSRRGSTRREPEPEGGRVHCARPYLVLIEIAFPGLIENPGGVR